MTKQKFDLGEKVFVFKTKGGRVAISHGRVKMAEINTGGYVQYTVVCRSENKREEWLVNHASIASTETEIKEKAAKYIEFAEAQKAIFAKQFGDREFSEQDVQEL